MEVHGVEIRTGIGDQAFEKLLGYVSGEKKARIGRFLRREDAQRSLLADVLVRVLVSKRSGLANGQLSFACNEYGKPYLRNPAGLHFNVSHSGDWVFCAVGESPVGIDVERVKEMGLGVAKSFFAPREYDDLLRKQGQERASYFFDLWTLKESYVKALGKGFSEPFSAFAITVDGERVDCVREHGGPAVFFRRWNLPDQYKLAVCAYEPLPYLDVQLHSFERFFPEYLLDFA